MNTCMLVGSGMLPVCWYVVLETAYPSSIQFVCFITIWYDTNIIKNNITNTIKFKYRYVINTGMLFLYVIVIGTSMLF
jgi:phage-related holin